MSDDVFLQRDEIYIIIDRFFNKIWGLYNTKDEAKFYIKILKATLPYEFEIKKFKEAQNEN